MQNIILGKSNIEVSRLCFGALTVGPLQANMSISAGGEVIAYAIEQGVNFIDTAQLYQTYPHIRRGMEISQKFDTVITSKTYAYDQKTAIAAVEEARRELNRDYIDIFLLHEQENEHTLKGHREAFEYLCECKGRGIIRAVGISTHHIAGVRAATKLNEIDVIHPMINKRGLGIVDGTVDEMLNAIRIANERNIGIYAMKVLGGGNLIGDVHTALDFVLNEPSIHSIAIGMQSIAEVDWNIAKFEGKSQEQLPTKTRRLHIESWCSACGSCVSRCKQGALRIDNPQSSKPPRHADACHPSKEGNLYHFSDLDDGKLVVDYEKCVLCGYCATACEEFCIKVI